MNNSEIARIREQIEQECIALRNLSLPSIVASHAAIRRQYDRLGRKQDELATIVGEKQAIEISCDIYNSVI